jgi:hypothetical protein
MTNPWIKKNPFMSMWLSGANAVGGSARNQIRAQSARHAATMMTSGANMIASFWRNALPTPVSRPRKR